MAESKAIPQSGQKQTSRGFYRDAAATVFASAGARLILFASMVVITRIYEAQDYGIWTIAFAFSGFFLPLVTLRYEIALVLAPTTELAQRIFWAIFYSSLLILILVLMLLILPDRNFLAAISGMPNTEIGWLWAVPMLVLLAGWQLLLQSWLMRDKRLMEINLALLVGALVTALVTVGGGIAFESKPLYAIAGGVLGQFANLILLCYYTRRSLLMLTKARPSFRDIFSAMGHYRVYPIFSLPYSLSIIFTDRALQISISALYSAQFLGIYYVARQLLLAPAQIVSAALRNVLLSHGAHKHDMDETRNFAIEILKLYCSVCAPLLATGIFWLIPISGYMLGNNWPGLSQMAWWCMFPGAILMLTGSLDRLFDLAGRQRLAVALQICSDLMILAVIVYVWFMAWPGSAMVALVCAAQTAYNLIWLVVVLRVINVSLKTMLVNASYFALLFSGVIAIQYLIKQYVHILYAPWLGLCLGLLITAITALHKAHGLRQSLKVNAGSFSDNNMALDIAAMREPQ